MTRRALFLLAMTLLLPWSRPTAAQATGAGFVIVAHPLVKVTKLSKGELAKIFLRKTASWPGGARILPVDQVVTSATREAFSKAVHGRKAKAIKQYWNQQIYSGNGVPPPEVADDAKVIAYVTDNAGAIGYVSAGAATGAAVVIAVAE